MRESGGVPTLFEARSLPVGRLRGRKECDEITSLYVWSRGVESGSSQSAKMEIPALLPPSLSRRRSGRAGQYTSGLAHRLAVGKARGYLPSAASAGGPTKSDRNDSRFHGDVVVDRAARRIRDIVPARSGISGRTERSGERPDRQHGHVVFDERRCAGHLLHACEGNQRDRDEWTVQRSHGDRGIGPVHGRARCPDGSRLVGQRPCGDVELAGLRQRLSRHRVRRRGRLGARPE